METKTDNPITVISECISKTEEFECEKLAKAISLQLGVSEYNNLIELINSTENISHKKFLAITLLRLYKNHETSIDNKQNLKRKIIQLFDDIFEHNLYKKLKITKKIQTHKKIPLLFNYLEEAESIQISIESLHKIQKFKEDFFKNFRGKYKEILTPFLDKKIITENMNNIFESVKDYSLNQNLQLFNEAKSLINESINICNNINSEYNNKFILNPLGQLLELIKKDFEKNPESQPSNIIISSNRKRYPLQSSKGSKFSLIIQLKNIESGKAYKTKLKILNTSKNIKIVKKEEYIGEIQGKKTINLEFETEIISQEATMYVESCLYWENYNQIEQHTNKKLSFSSQRTDIDWEQLKEKDAYSIEAIDSEDELIGRYDILNELYKGLKKKKNINSFYIHGQKRVGKTSIAKALKSKLDKEKDEFVAIYIEAGDSVGTTFKDTIKNLGNKICRHLKREYQNKLDDIEIPEFNDSIQPLVDFLDDVSYKLQNKKIVFILDEFDEISSELYKRSNIGDAFFLTIRSLSNKPYYSFILVGGEKIDFIISIQGEQLNKFDSCRVDYFDKEHWQQFKELVQKPVNNYIDITDKAIEKIYNETAGNPFFTNVICKEMLNLAIDKKDTHITDIEIKKAICKSLQKAETQRFSHLWEDGIREDNDKEEEISYKRRSILLSFATLNKEGKKLKLNNIKDDLITEFEENEIERILKEFIDRKILIEKNDEYIYRIDFFKKWLFKYGAEKIIMTLSDEQKIKKREKENKEAKISSSEIKSFIDTKKIVYNSKQITTDDIRVYLEQFKNNIEQRVVFNILNYCTYYDVLNIKIIMKRLFDEIKSYITHQEIPNISYSKTKITNIVVSNLDNLGKSSTQYAKYFADENNIMHNNIVYINKLLDKVNNDNNINFLIFIDDFIGTGTSIIDNIKKIKTEYPEIFNKDIYIFIGIITGFLDAKEHIENELFKLNLKNIKIIVHEPLDEKDKCFSISSKIFTNPQKRKEAENLCWDKGKKLVNKNPLGYGDCQATVIFPDTCPNNCLPILWKETKDFKPLFKRVIT
jgi:hypothetical protein